MKKGIKKAIEIIEEEIKGWNEAYEKNDNISELFGLNTTTKEIKEIRKARIIALKFVKDELIQYLHKINRYDNTRKIRKTTGIVRQSRN